MPWAAPLTQNAGGCKNGRGLAAPQLCLSLQGPSQGGCHLLPRSPGAGCHKDPPRRRPSSPLPRAAPPRRPLARLRAPPPASGAAQGPLSNVSAGAGRGSRASNAEGGVTLCSVRLSTGALWL